MSWISTRIFFFEHSKMHVDYSLVENIIPSLVSSKDNLNLTRMPSLAKIRLVIFDMGPSSSPGPDGFTGRFFKACYEIIGSDVVHVVQGFFLQGFFLNGRIHLRLNSKIMALIPKMPSTLRLEHYTPIAMSNFVFKVITRIIVDLLSIICSKILLENQYGFLKGRNGRDAIVGAAECFTDLHKCSYDGAWQLKLIFIRPLILLYGILFRQCWLVLGFLLNSFLGSRWPLNRLEFLL